MRRGWTADPSCRRVMQELQGYLDGESDADTAWRISRHLSRCEDCFGDAEDFRALKAAVVQLRTAPDPDAMRRLRTLVTTLTENPPTDV
jgi:anti-sigma factor RsiW